ncbi:MAG: metallophosphoesterase [Victivallales bacterium]|nr:metallophosphoesterase [Victivallales bacterium]
MGTTFVSYRTNRLMALAIPQGTRATASDFGHYQTGEATDATTEFTVWQEDGSLVLQVLCHDPHPEQVCTDYAEDGMDIWKGDLLEIFFGAIDPIPWQLQLAVGAGGGKFDSCGKQCTWSAETARTPYGWSALVRIPIRRFRLSNLGVYFNLCRQRPGRGPLTSWEPLLVGFHETENYGQLLFCDYDLAYFSATGAWVPGKLDRQGYEQAMEAFATPAEQVTHGPFLAHPDCGEVTLAWETAGRCATTVHYREKGNREWTELPWEHQTGILFSDRIFHQAHLTGLHPGKEYEYRLAAMTFLKKKAVLTESPQFHFRTFASQPEAFSFAAVSDIHSNALTLRRLLNLPQVAGTAFLANLGDMLSLQAGADTFYDGYLDVECGSYAQNHPLVIVRGNHEQLGIFSSTFLEMMGHPTGKTYSAFSHAGVCFANLDIGSDHEDDSAFFDNSTMIDEEREWLRELTLTPQWQEARFRVALLHIPPYRTDKYDGQAPMRLIQGILDTPEARLDVMLSGHVHRYFRIDPGTGRCTPPLPYQEPPALPFQVIANDTTSLLLGEVSSDTLTISCIRQDGTVQDRIALKKR